ncbi:MAG TPA: F0F1 ATP synthase subunit A [Herpetosiphonaceae bacterium]
MSTKSRILTVVGIALVVGTILYITGIGKVGSPHVSVSAEAIIEHPFGLPFNITNSLLTTWVVMLILIILSAVATSKLRSGNAQALVEPRGSQNLMELVVEQLYNVMEGVSPKFVGRFFVLVATIFFLVLPSNWSGLIPGVGSIGICHTPAEGGEHGALSAPTIASASPVWSAAPTYAAADACAAGEVLHPFFRAPSADLNLTLALALISFLVTEFWGFRTLGIGYLGKFFNFKNGPIQFLVGLIELISEFARIISFTFRLFGNIFAGEVVLLVMAFLFPVILPLPFYGLELFVGFIQAFVFAMLTMAFIDMAAESHGDHGDHGHAH